MLRVHLVFGERDSKLIKEINKYGIITGWDYTLEAAGIWAEKGGGEDPDTFLINSTVYFTNLNKQKSPKIKDFLRMIFTIKKFRHKSRIIVLLPEKKIADRELIVNLLKMQIYNFWFLDNFDEDDVRAFMLTQRTLEEIEQYLEKKERELPYLKEGKGNNSFWEREGEKIFKPYHVKSNVLTFWSENNTFSNCGMALLTALNLAENGFKVALVETVAQVPTLASCLALEHPYYNTSHALSMYIQGNNDFIKKCFYNAEKYLKDPYTVNVNGESSDYLRYLPEGLYFLPDGKREDNAAEDDLMEHWQAFVTELSRIMIFEKGFHFLIFICAGRNFFNQVVLEELTYTKFLTVDLLPASVLYGLREREKGQGSTQIIGTKQVKYLNKEIKGLNEEPFLYPPVSFEEDFLHYVYSQDYRQITGETQAFINKLMEICGVKISTPDVDKKSLGERVRAYLKR